MSAGTTPRTLRINGNPVTSRCETLEAVLVERGVPVDRRGIAVALNGAVVPRRDWARTRVSVDDSIEVVGAVQGG